MKRQSSHGGSSLDCFATSSTEELVTTGVHICCAGRMHIHMACDLLQLLKKLIRHIPRTSKLTEGLLVGLVRLVSSFKAPIFPRPAKALTVSQPVKACMPSRASEKPLPALMALACCSSIFKEYVALASTLIVRQYRSNLPLSSDKMWMDPASSVSNLRQRCFLMSLWPGWIQDSLLTTLVLTSDLSRVLSLDWKRDHSWYTQAVPHGHVSLLPHTVFLHFILVPFHQNLQQTLHVCIHGSTYGNAPQQQQGFYSW